MKTQSLPKNGSHQKWLHEALGDPNYHHPKRIVHLCQHEHRFDMTGIEMPMQLKDILRFEIQNDISVSVY